jgi:peptidoglycan/LPS O-acetylase OafA/YrhL
LGRLGVDIFFVLSGFLITTILLKEKIALGHISLKKFYRRRALRILPAAYTFLLVMVLVNHFFYCEISFKSFACSFLFLKNLPIRGISDHWTNHFWSLSVEEQFYLFFPVLLIFNVNKTALFSLVAVLAVLLFSLLGYYRIGPFYNIPELYRFCRLMMYTFWEGPLMILVGCLFAIGAFKGLIDFSSYRKKYFLSASLFVAAVVIHSNTFLFYTPYLSEFIFAVLMGIIILLCIDGNNFFANLLQSRFLMQLGTWSYSIYIWQQLVVWISFHWFNEKFIEINTNVLFVLGDLIRLAAIIGLACLSYYLIERPFLKIKIRLSKSAAPV